MPFLNFICASFRRARSKFYSILLLLHDNFSSDYPLFHYNISTGSVQSRFPGAPWCSLVRLFDNLWTRPRFVHGLASLHVYCRHNIPDVIYTSVTSLLVASKYQDYPPKLKLDWPFPLFISLFPALFFVLMLWKFWTHIRCVDQHSLPPILVVFYRDGTLFFFLQVILLCPPHCS